MHVRGRHAPSALIGAAMTMGVIALPVAVCAAPPPQAALCAGCHGAGGLGNLPAGFPALAGLPADYIAQQLYDYKHGERQNAVMKSMASNLDAAQRSAIGAYYAAMVVAATPEPAPLPGGVGAVLATDGDWRQQLNGVPACDACHGPYGIGVGAAFPRLAGQSKVYLAAQLTAWQKGARSGDPLHLMHNIAARLTDAQIDAVAAYYAALAANPTALPGLDAAEGGK